MTWIEKESWRCKAKKCFNPSEPGSDYCTECGMEVDDDKALREDLGMDDEEEYEDRFNPN